MTTKNGGIGKKSVKVATPQIRSSFRDEALRQQIGTAFSEKRHLEHDSGLVLHNAPFAACEMPNFVEDSEFLVKLKKELLGLEFYEKNNDLYKFKQSRDLKKVRLPHCEALKRLIYQEFASWIRDCVHIEVDDTVDLTCAQYAHTDTLLCHDDELEGRRVAFILYLVPDWSVEQDGGQLDLFDMDKHRQPRSVVKSLVPAWNKLVWFEVTPASFHQVAEILSQDKTRVSLGGWLHGPTAPWDPPHVEPPPPLLPYGSVEESLLYSWINPVYLDPVTQSEIQDKFSSESEIQLPDFLMADRYTALVEAMANVAWERRGPANKRCYEAAVDPLTPVLAECLAVLQSDALFLTMANLTGLKLHELAPASSDEEDDDTGGEPGTKKLKTCAPRCSREVRRWTHGHYTLVHDTDSESGHFALDALLYVAVCPDWAPAWGGYTAYIAKGEDEELLSVAPSSNCLALVYRDQESLRFVKHVNARCGAAEFYDLALSYYE